MTLEYGELKKTGLDIRYAKLDSRV
jgi:hypothetical protein